MDFEQVIKLALFLAPAVLFLAWYFGKSSKDIYYEEIAAIHKRNIQIAESDREK